MKTVSKMIPIIYGRLLSPSFSLSFFLSTTRRVIIAHHPRLGSGTYNSLVTRQVFPGRRALRGQDAGKLLNRDFMPDQRFFGRGKPGLVVPPSWL